MNHQVTDFIENPENPWQYTEDDLQDLISKIQRDPKFMKLRPIVYDPQNRVEDKLIVLGGNKRLVACQRLSTWTDAQMDQIKRLTPDIDTTWLNTLRSGSFPEGWVQSAEGMTGEEKRRFVFADNKTYGDVSFEFVTKEEAEDWSIEWTQSEPVDYSQKNKEINVNDFSDEMILKLTFPEAQYNEVKTSLLNISSTPEMAILELLGITEEE